MSSNQWNLTHEVSIESWNSVLSIYQKDGEKDFPTYCIYKIRSMILWASVSEFGLTCSAFWMREKEIRASCLPLLLPIKGGKAVAASVVTNVTQPKPRKNNWNSLNIHSQNDKKDKEWYRYIQPLLLSTTPTFTKS